MSQPAYLPTYQPAYLRTSLPTYLFTYHCTYIHTYLPINQPTYQLYLLPSIFLPPLPPSPSDRVSLCNPIMAVLPPQPPECCDHRHEPPHPALSVS